MTESTVNIPLLRKAVEWAEAEAAKTDGTSQWYQGDFISIGACGTTYCIAGWTLFASGWTNEEIDATDDVAHEAANLLGISRFDGDPSAGAHLFSDDNSIDDVRRIAEEIAGERL